LIFGVARGCDFHIPRICRSAHASHSEDAIVDGVAWPTREKSVKHLVYISGPSCSGKTSVSQGLRRIAPHLFYISGDQFWNVYQEMPFGLRLKSTNQMILDAIRSMKERHILLDWVPSSGRFRSNLLDVCRDKGRVLTHIVLYAPVEVLQQRKQARDGNRDLGELPSIRALAETDCAVAIDTDQDARDVTLDKCIAALRARKLL